LIMAPSRTRNLTRCAPLLATPIFAGVIMPKLQLPACARCPGRNPDGFLQAALTDLAN
jgi:hypothetical protein